MWILLMSNAYSVQIDVVIDLSYIVQYVYGATWLPVFLSDFVQFWLSYLHSKNLA